jgi:glycosyltransferase involved in cell wall biosynthesis
MSEQATELKRPVVYQDLLIESLFRPIMTTPYTHRDNYFIAFMRSYGKYLAERYATRPQSKLVSIVMPTFNRAHCIGDSIRSVLAQTYSKWELLVIDDCSSDDTATVVSSFQDERIRYLRLEKHLGCASARNAALDRMSGAYITYLDSDNTMAPDFLLILANELEADGDIDMVYCAQRGFQVSNGQERERFVRFAPFHRPSMENRNYIDAGVVMHRWSFVEQFGKFNTQMQRLVDWEYILRCTVEKSPKGVPAILSNYYYDKDDNQITRVHAIDEAIAVIDASLRSRPVSRELAAIPLSDLELVSSLPYEVAEPATRRSVSIIIPSFEAEPYLRACIEAICAFSTGHRFELIIVDNGSSLPVRAYLTELAEQGRAKILLNDANLGFTFAVNQGIESALTQNDIVIMNNDAIVTRGWLDALQGVLCDYPDTGLIVPSQIVLPGEKTLAIHQPHCNLHRECDINISAHHANVLNPLFQVPKGYMELAYAPFFCVYIPRSTLEQVGMLDSVNGPQYRSDRLYCDMVRQCAGRRILYTPRSKVYHFVQRSTAVLKRVDPEGYERTFVRHEPPRPNPDL